MAAPSSTAGPMVPQDDDALSGLFDTPDIKDPPTTATTEAIHDSLGRMGQGSLIFHEADNRLAARPLDGMVALSPPTPTAT